MTPRSGFRTAVPRMRTGTDTVRTTGAMEARCGGILLHPTSLPGARTHGALGEAASAFVAFLASAGCRVWQMLPISPVGPDRSPYLSISLFAGGEHLICLRRLRAECWFGPRLAGAPPFTRTQVLDEAARRFFRHAPAAEREALQAFVVGHRGWLEPYCAFRVLKRRHRGMPWQRWPAEWRDAPGHAWMRLTTVARHALERELFVQYVFERQWAALHAVAAQAGVALFGDLAIYPAPDSADVWADRRLFRLDRHGDPLETGGVPPDRFAAAGQAWGSALYDWDRMADEDYRWWVERVRLQGERFDLLRIDHFRGLESYWAIPAGAAVGDGHWRRGPGAPLLRRLAATPGPPPLVAEDLGRNTPRIEALRRRFGLPGIRVLQFAFDGDSDNPHLPRNHRADTVVYTGTHDNDTLVGWWRRLDPAARAAVGADLGLDGVPTPERLIECLLASPAWLAILPMQDLLGLGGRARMNVPGRARGNWRWRLRRGRLQPALALAHRLRAMLQRAGRAGP